MGVEGGHVEAEIAGSPACEEVDGSVCRHIVPEPDGLASLAAKEFVAAEAVVDIYICICMCKYTVLSLLSLLRFLLLGGEEEGLCLCGLTEYLCTIHFPQTAIIPSFNISRN